MYKNVKKYYAKKMISILFNQSMNKYKLTTRENKNETFLADIMPIAGTTSGPTSSVNMRAVGDIGTGPTQFVTFHSIISFAAFWIEIIFTFSVSPVITLRLDFVPKSPITSNEV